MLKLYALLLVGMFLILLNAGVLSALLRSRNIGRLVRLVLALALITAASLIFFTSYKMVLLLSLAAIATIFFLWRRDRNQTLIKRS